MDEQTPAFARTLTASSQSGKLVRMAHHAPHVPMSSSARAKGKTNLKIRCCLKRYIMRQLFRNLALQRPPEKP